MPITQRKGKWFWGGQGPFDSQEKAEEVAQAAHASGYVSKSVTDNICSTFDNGILTSTSIIPNGHAFKYAMKEYNFRSKLNLSIHINLVEGKPLSPSEEVSQIIGPNGEFNQSFHGLWLKYFFSKKSMRTRVFASRLVVQRKAGMLKK